MRSTSMLPPLVAILIRMLCSDGIRSGLDQLNLEGWLKTGCDACSKWQNDKARKVKKAVCNDMADASRSIVTSTHSYEPLESWFACYAAYAQITEGSQEAPLLKIPDKKLP